MKKAAEPLTAQQKNFLLDLIARVLGIRRNLFAALVQWEMGISIGGAALLQGAANAALRCKGVLPVPAQPVDDGTRVDTQGLAAAAAGLAQQGNENAPTIAPSAAGNDETPPAPQNPIKSPSRASERKPRKKEDFGHIDVPAEKCREKGVLEAYAKAIVNDEATIITLDGGKIIGVKGAGGKGSRAYNNREFAKHAAKVRRWRKESETSVTFTKTAGAEYGSADTDIDGAQFVADVSNSLKLLAKTTGARWYFCSEFGGGQNLHCHGEIIFPRVPRKMSRGKGGESVDEKTRAYLDKYLHFKDFEKVQWLDPARGEEWFSYCHKFTQFNASQLLAAKNGGDEEAYEKARACLENLLLCQKYHVTQWRGSSSKGAENIPAQNTETENQPQGAPKEQPAQNTEYDSAVFALQEALKPETDDRAVLLAVKNAIKMVFPCACVERYIVNATYTPKNNTKLSEWREMALRGAKIKPCDCFFKQLYFHITDLLEKM